MQPFKTGCSILHVVEAQPDVDTNVKMKSRPLLFFVQYLPSIPAHAALCTTLFLTFLPFSPSPLLPRSCCTSCPSSPRKMISISSSNISGARRAWWMKRGLTRHPPSGSARAVSGSSSELCSAVTKAFVGKKQPTLPKWIYKTKLSLMLGYRHSVISTLVLQRYQM